MSRMMSFWGVVERPSGESADSPADQTGPDDQSSSDEAQTEEPQTYDQTQAEETQPYEQPQSQEPPVFDQTQSEEPPGEYEPQSQQPPVFDQTQSEEPGDYEPQSQQPPVFDQTQSEEPGDYEPQSQQPPVFDQTQSEEPGDYEPQSQQPPVFDQTQSEEPGDYEPQSQEQQSEETDSEEPQAEEEQSEETDSEEPQGENEPQAEESPSDESEESETEDSDTEEQSDADESETEEENEDSETEEQETDESESDDLATDEQPNAPAPTVKEQNKQKNVESATKKFGSTGSDFATLKNTDQLNPRQKQIFDQKLKQAIEKDPRAQKGEMSEADLKKLAQKAADVADKLSKTPLNKDVNDLSLKSDTLKDNLVDLQNNGWKIKVGKRGGGSFTDKAAKTITIDPKDSTKDIVEGLAHETGHAEYTAPADPSVSDPSPDVAKGREYIRKVVENNLLDEGQAQIVAAKTAKELEAKGETGINIPGGHSAEYKAVYTKIVDGTMTMDEGRKAMAKIMGSETTSNSGENYIDYYSKAPRKSWNKAHPKAKVPAKPRVDVFP